MMKKVLVYGLTGVLGGKENVIINSLFAMDRDGLEIHLLVYEEPVFYEELREKGFIIHSVPRRGEDYMGNKKQTEKLFAECSFDAVWINICTLSYIEPLVQAKKFNVPVRIVHVHCPEAAGGWKMKLLHFFHRRPASKAANYYFACSQGAADFSFSEAMQSGDRFRLINNAVNLDTFAFSAEKRREIREELKLTDQLLLGHVGRFSDVKNHAFLIEVFRELSAIRSDAHLVLVGDGELEEDIRSRVARYGLEDRVLFLGRRTDTDRIYSGLDLLVFPSKYEGLPLVLVEAQASGLPCLVSDTVSEESQITDLVRYLSLGIGPEEWANMAIKLAEGRERRSPIKELREAGFDLGENAELLKRVFLNELD